jgi:hypothetical protein
MTCLRGGSGSCASCKENKTKLDDSGFCPCEICQCTCSLAYNVSDVVHVAFDFYIICTHTYCSLVCQIDAHSKAQLSQLANCTGAVRKEQAVQASNSALEVANIFKTTHVMAGISAKTQELNMNGSSLSATAMEEHVMFSMGKQFASTFHGDSTHQAFIRQQRKKLKPTTLVELPDGSTLDTRALGSKKDHRKATNRLDSKLAASFTSNNKKSLLYPKSTHVAASAPTPSRRHEIPPSVSGFSTPFAKLPDGISGKSFMLPLEIDSISNSTRNSNSFEQGGTFNANVAEDMLDCMQICSLRESGAVASTRTIMNVETCTDEVVAVERSDKVRRMARCQYKKVTELKNNGPQHNAVLDFIDHSMTIR